MFLQYSVFRRTVLELDTKLLKMLGDGQNNRVVLIEWCTVHAFESVDPGQFVHEAVDISSKLDGRVPWLKGEPGHECQCLDYANSLR